MAGVLLRPSLEIRLVADPAALARHPVYGRRPALRGRFHQLAAIASVPLGVHLVAAAARDGARLPVAIYAITWTAMLATSAVYHRVAQTVRARFWMRRLDHSMILVHIAGATTPLALLGAGGLAGATIAGVAWAGAAAGAGGKMTRLTGDHDPCHWTFPLLGSLPLLTAPGVLDRAGVVGLSLLLVSIAAYGLGAVCFARKSPDPVPTVFGYHEVWHAFTLVAGLAQLALVAELAR